MVVPVSIPPSFRTLSAPKALKLSTVALALAIGIAVGRLQVVSLDRCIRSY